LFHHCNLSLGVTTVCEQSNAGVTAWTTIASLPTAVYHLSMVTLNGKAYVFGGMTDPTGVYMYDGVSSWVNKTAMSPGRQGHMSLSLDNDRALICGGYAPGTIVATCVIYTASANTWATTLPMAQQRVYFALTMLQGCFN
jgi:hypothetical protein